MNHDELADRFLMVGRVTQYTGVALIVVAVILYWISDDGRGGRRRLPLPPNFTPPEDVDAVAMPLCEVCEIRARRLAAQRT